VNDITKNFFLISATVHLVGLTILFTIPVGYIKKALNIYFIYILVSLYPITVIEIMNCMTTSLFWWISTPVVLYAVHFGKKGVRIAWICFLLMISVCIVAIILRYSIYGNALLEFNFKSHFIYMVRANIISAACSLLLIFFSLRYVYKLYLLKIEQLSEMMKTSANTEDLLNMNKENYKYEKIYARIEEYFEQQQPYLDANFSLSKVSNDLNINQAYLSKAISYKKNTNFNNFVNTYRIAKAKELIQNNPNQYTLQYIFQTSGFKSQPTFNKAFKDVEGITPSEYYKKFDKTK
jgi:AraC-like DNA-binding protein